ncbi:MAG TPA: hypothetical protein VLF62_04150 [Candidatus Saccharimonadales bacterium]|nr:hypothetical protein [Candidatus Saccharimonadales bacterium]
MIELIPQYTYQVGSAGRTGSGGRRLRQLVKFTFEDLDPAGSQAVKSRVSELCGLVATRNAETPDKPLPDDFPVFVAPITKVSPLKGDASELTVSLDSSCLGTRIPDRDMRIREFSAAIGDFVLGFDGEPDPASATGPVPAAEASAAVASAPAAPAPKGFEKLLLG